MAEKHGSKTPYIEGNSGRGEGKSGMRFTFEYHYIKPAIFASRTHTRPSPYFGMTPDTIRKLAYDGTFVLPMKHRTGMHNLAHKEVDELTKEEEKTLGQMRDLMSFIERCRNVIKASEMVGVGTGEYESVVDAFDAGIREAHIDYQKMPVKMTGTAAAIVAHYEGYKGGDILENASAKS